MQKIPDPRAPYNQKQAVSELLELLCLKGCMVTIDAMGTRKEIAEKIMEKEAVIIKRYVLNTRGRKYGKSKRSHLGIENSLHWVLDIGLYHL